MTDKKDNVTASTPTTQPARSVYRRARNTVAEALNAKEGKRDTVPTVQAQHDDFDMLEEFKVLSLLSQNPSLAHSVTPVLVAITAASNKPAVDNKMTAKKQAEILKPERVLAAEKMVRPQAEVKDFSELLKLYQEKKVFFYDI